MDANIDENPISISNISNSLKIFKNIVRDITDGIKNKIIIILKNNLNHIKIYFDNFIDLIYICSINILTSLDFITF